MKKFEFRNNNLSLEIAGENFEIDVALASGALPKVAKKFESAIADFRSENVPADEKTINACRVTCECIDAILGEKASEKIFKNRKVNFYDCMDVYMYAIGEIRGFQASKNREYGIHKHGLKK